MTSLASAGKVVFWLAVAAGVLAALVLAVKLGPHLARWARGRRGFLAGFLAALLGRRRRQRRRRGPHPLSGWEALEGVAPHAAVRAAYGRLLAVARWAGSARAQDQTPWEFLAHLPSPLLPAADTVRDLTDVYVRVEYGPTPASEDDRRKALDALARLAAALRG